MDEHVRSLIEGLVVARWEGMGVDPEIPEGAAFFAERLIPKLAIRHVPRSELQGDDARLIRRPEGKEPQAEQEGPVILLADDLGPRAENFALGHESMEWITHAIGYRRPDREAVCNFGAGAIIAPRPAMVRAAQAVGLNPARLAELFVCGVVAITLRYGEVTGQPLAVVTPKSVQVRGESWAWGSAARLRKIAFGGEKCPFLRRRDLGAKRVLLEPKE